MANDTLVYKTLRAMTDTSVPILPIDQLTVGANNGVRFLFDLANGFSWTPGVPIQGKVVNDIAQISSNAIVNTSGGTLANLGNGIDFTNSTGRAAVTVPAGVIADLWADQYYILCAYYKLPLEVNFPAAGAAGRHTTMFTAQSGDTDNFDNSPEIGMAAWDNAVFGRLRFSRPINNGTGTGESINIDMRTPTNHAGLLVQVALYRTSVGWYARMKSSAGTTLGSNTNTNVKNTYDFSAKAYNFGPSGSMGITTTSARNGLRLYRGFIENLQRSGRNPVTVLDDDYARTVARGVYS